MNNENVLIQLEGYADDLLMVNSPDNVTSMKSTRLIDINPLETDPYSEVVDIAVTSTCGNGKHEVFDKLLGKKIRITVEEI